MKTVLAAALAVSFAATVSAHDTSSRTVTFVIASTNVGETVTNQYEVAEWETVEVVHRTDDSVGLDVIKDGYIFKNIPLSGIYAGPATLLFFKEYSGATQAKPATLITIRFEPETFPPDKTIVIPEGTSARVVLGTSTNLTNWDELWVDNLTNAPSHKFYRVTAEQTQ